MSHTLYNKTRKEGLEFGPHITYANVMSPHFIFAFTLFPFFTLYEKKTIFMMLRQLIFHHWVPSHHMQPHLPPPPPPSLAHCQLKPYFSCYKANVFQNFNQELSSSLTNPTTAFLIFDMSDVHFGSMWMLVRHMSMLLYLVRI